MNEIQKDKITIKKTKNNCSFVNLGFDSDVYFNHMALFRHAAVLKICNINH